MAASRHNLQISLAALALLSGSAASASPAFDQGAKLYGQKQYGHAATQFMQAVKDEPTNARAAYYAATSYYASGKLPDAINVYWYVVKKCPTTTEAATAKDFLKRIDKKFLADSTDATIGVIVPAKEASTAPAVATPAAPGKSAAKPAAEKPRRSLSKEQIVEQLVQIAPRRSTLPDLGLNFVSEIKEALLQYPKPVLELLYDHHCKIMLMPSVIENDFRMQNIQPGGYWEGSSFDNVPAYFYNSTIALGEYAKSPSGAGFQPATGYVGTLRHEVGHAIDFFLGHISNSDSFTRAWEDDCRDPTARANSTKLAYYLTEGERGQAETFAELCCIITGGRTDEHRSADDELLRQACKHCMPLVQEAIDGLKK